MSRAMGIYQELPEWHSSQELVQPWRVYARQDLGITFDAIDRLVVE